MVANTLVSPIAGRADSLASAGVSACPSAIAPRAAITRSFMLAFLRWVREAHSASSDKTGANRLTVRSEGARQVEAVELPVPKREEVVDLRNLTACERKDLEGAQPIHTSLVALIGSKCRTTVGRRSHQPEARGGLADKELGLQKPLDRRAALVPER